ncbi:MAG: mechanosensitive ion channel family protein [Ignavibacteriaceae bacterium]|nr:mechanosensitive ion channel family protein [Ignavibacteriaceae bacterium]
MMPGAFRLPFFSTIEFLAFVFAVYFLIRILVKFISYVKPFRRSYVFLKKILPILDLALAATIIFWIIYSIFGDTDLLPVITSTITIILLGLLGWFWGRDFVAGIILKSENYFELNKMIRLNNKSGKIIKTTLRYLEFETDEGEAVRVPYNKISGDYFSKLSPDEKYESHLITLHLNEDSETKSLRESIRKRIYNSPWYLSGKEPAIEIISSAEGGYKINLNVYTINSSHADLIRRELVEGLGK